MRQNEALEQAGNLMNCQGNQMSVRQQHYLQKFFLIAVSLCIFLVSIWLSIVVHQPVAFAHAFVIGSDPVDGSTISSAPSVVRIYFDAPISPASAAYVYNPQEQVVNATHSIIPSNNPRELDTPLKNPDQLPLGSYIVRWTALATDDGHTTHGVIGFNIGQSSTGLSGVTILGPSTSNTLPTLDLIGLLAVAWEWLITVALMFWIGILVIEGIVYNGEEHSSALLIRCRKQTQPWQWLCLSALLVGEIIVLILRAAQFTQSLNGNTLDPAVLSQLLFQSTYGSLWIARVIFILGSLGLLCWTTDRQNQPDPRNRTRSGFSRHNDYMMQEQFLAKKGTQVAESQSTTSLALSSSLRAFTIAWLILASLILITYALSGDAAQRDTQLPIYAIVLGWLSLAAQYTWFGGLAYLGYVLLPLLSIIEPDRRTGTLTSLLGRFHALILGAICALVVSELYLSKISLSNVQQFVTEPYGRALLVKWALILMMIIFSAYALFVLRPKLTRQVTAVPLVNAELLARQVRQSRLNQLTSSFGQVLSVQSWLGAGVLLCAALMAFFAPPIVFPNTHYSQNARTGIPSSTINTQTKQVGHLSVTLSVIPEKVNASNTVTVKITDTRSGKLVTNAHIEVSTNMEVMDMGTAQATMTGGTPTYSATFTQDEAFSMAGVWDIGLTIQLPKQVPVVVVFAVTLGDS